jgi:hypothetical protein
MKKSSGTRRIVPESQSLPMQRTILTAFIFIGAFLVSSIAAQERSGSLHPQITKADAAFWNAYNKCDLKMMLKMVSDDVEFYHDKGGPTLGSENFITRLKTGICSDAQWRLRREPVKGTVQMFPLANASKVYGYVIEGQHQFYVTETGKRERLNDRSRFMMLWLLNAGVWKASRIISYEHAPTRRSRNDR